MALQATTDGIGHIAPTVNQAHDISVAPHANAVFAGGNVSIHTHHHHDPPQQVINIVEVLRLVPNLRKIHLDVFSKATPGTGVWVVKTRYFQLWLDPNGTLKILWGSGIPGAGKSVMASVVINDLEARAEASGGSICLAYVYFRYSDAGDLTVRSVLEILVKQTVERHPDCAIIAGQAYATHVKERTQPTQTELLQLLQRFTEVKSATFYFLDALDEAPEKLRLDIVRVLALLKAKLFITSRSLKSIEAKFTDAHSFTIVAQDRDLDLHISREVSRCEDLEDLLDADPIFKEEVIFSIKKNCGGMFLHASLQLDAISRCATAQDILDTLEDFPSDIEDVYHLTWTRILNQNARNILIAKAVLVWVLNAARSMTIEELRHVVAAHPDTYKFEPKRLASPATLITLCCGLLIVEEETKLVRLIHYTAKDTLSEHLRESFPHPHSFMTAVCITHLTRCRFQNTTIGSVEEFSKMLQRDPLLAYASHAWSTHAALALDLPESRHRIATFVSRCRAFPSFANPDRTDIFDILAPLHMLAAHGLPFDLAADGLASEPNITTRKDKMTPLMLAAWRGNVGMAKTLLDLKEIQVNLTDADGWSALAYAAQEGHENVAKHLLDHPDVQVNVVNNEGRPALMYAAHRGDKGLVELFLARPEIQLNLVNNEGQSALMYAAHRGHEGVVQLFLAHPGVQVNLVDCGGWTALMNAARCGHEDVAKLLLAHVEIKVNMVNNKGESALNLAAEKGHKGVAKLLLAHQEIQVNLVNNEGCSALILAASKGHEGVSQLLLSRPGIQVNILNNTGRPALIYAAHRGNSCIVQLLLAHPEVQVNVVDNEGWSALMGAASEGHEAVTQLLLAHPAIQVNMVDNDGWPALIFAARYGHKGVAQLLLAHREVQVNMVDNDGWSALLFAANEGYEAVAKLLLAVPEIQVNIINSEGWSALMKAALHGHEHVVRPLLVHPEVQVNMTDKEGWSALMNAASEGHEAVVKLLLAHPEIQVDLATPNGETALAIATECGHESIVHLLSSQLCRHGHS